jgi:tRNA(Ile)-lysidine synthase
MAKKNKPLNRLFACLDAVYSALPAAERSVLLAVSGGADSTALMLVSAALAPDLSLALEVACLDHGLRAESAGEVEQVRRHADHLGLTFHTRRLKLRSRSEEEARAARYQALEDIRDQRGLALIATAHTANDQAETVLMRLSRGSALRGAAAILPRRGNVIRPLLGCTRTEVEAFLAEPGVPFALDAMNEDSTFLRTRIRRQALPALVEAAGSKSIEHLASFAALAAEDDAYLEARAAEAFERIALKGRALDRPALLELAPSLQRRVLVRLIEAAGARVDSTSIKGALAAVREGRTSTLSRGWLLKAEGRQVRCARERSAPFADEPLALQADGKQVQDPRWGWCFRLGRKPWKPAESSLNFSLPEVPLPLVVRRRKLGDRVGSKKLKDLLISSRIPREVRDELPIVCDADGKIVWVPGLWPKTSAGHAALFVQATETSHAHSSSEHASEL